MHFIRDMDDDTSAYGRRLEAFEMWIRRRIERISWMDEVMCQEK